MGRQWEDFTISASLSRHNSDQDITDDGLWEELQQRIELILREHRYEPINPMVL